MGNDNDQDLAEQPGNQLAGFDVRWSWPGARVPLALYAQGIGEDEAGFMPSKYLGLFGAEVWGDLAAARGARTSSTRTRPAISSTRPEFGCAYTNNIYTSGYRYRGRCWVTRWTRMASRRFAPDASSPAAAGGSCTAAT